MSNVSNPGLQSAKEAGLKYCTDEISGIARMGGRMPYYVNSQGKRIKDRATLKRIQALVIPPAWKNVWIAPLANHHLQVTGRDERGRKQYRYHPRWQENRDAGKYAKLVDFAKALPKIRRRVTRDLQKRGLPREKVLAAIVRLIETTSIRIGNDEYARTNHSFGLTTMQDRHAKVGRTKIKFCFRGKSGIEHEFDIESPALARIVKQCQELPGQELFQYEDETGKVRDIGSTDVNDYLREISGQDITAKDFRTWAGTVAAAAILQEFAEIESEAQAKRNVVEAIKRVAVQLGNTVAVCRKAYIHPAICEAYMDRTLLQALSYRSKKKSNAVAGALKSEEIAVLAFLQKSEKK